MRITKHGTKPVELINIYAATCSSCGCEFEYKYTDRQLACDGRPYIKCPEPWCGGSNWVPRSSSSFIPIPIRQDNEDEISPPSLDAMIWFANLLDQKASDLLDYAEGAECAEYQIDTPDAVMILHELAENLRKGKF